jgi:alkanesulfonate monooxygenase SsuD/methylene tetrahydromethanopterin reductase-like flavin-dependent oxidoreductase (luciferase family)
MLKFHFMHQYEIPNEQSMIENSFIFENVGYESVLYPFTTNTPDNWFKIIRTLNTNHKFKYMVALRPFHLSPEYCAMMIEAMNQIQPNRLILNLLSGQNTPNQKEHETFYDNTYTVDSKQDRREYVRFYIEKLLSNNLISVKPKFVISGYSEYAIDTAKQYNQIILSMLAEYRGVPNRFLDVKRKMVAINLLIRDTWEEANDSLDYMIESWINPGYTEKEKQHIRKEEKINTFLGTAEQVKEQLLSLEQEGITDVLVSIFSTDIDRLSVYHDFMKNIIKENK